MKTSVEICSKLAAMLSQVRTIGAGVAVGVGVATDAGFLIATPLSQTSFVPDLMQVNFFPDVVAVDPAFVHLAPALGAAA